MPIFDRVQNKAWAIQPAKLDEINAFITARINGEDLESALKSTGKSGNGADDSYQILDGVAVIPVFGTIAKRMNMFSNISGGTSSELIRRDITSALSDPKVQGVLLDIESPGGSVDGTKELSDFIYSVRGKKPIIAFANGLMASAAYWIGSAADCIIATDTAIVGSIGVAMTHYDRSASDKSDGVTKTEIYAGKFKRLASDTKPLSEDGQAYLQSIVDTYYEMFVQSVAKNRGVSIDEALAMADGKDFIGKQALDVGLVDFIGTMETATGKAKQRSFKKTMDIKTFQEQHPDLFSQVKKMGAEEAAVAFEKSRADIKAEGSKEERARVFEIMGADGDPIVTAACIKEGLSASDTFKRLFEAEKNGRAAKLEAMKKAAPPNVGQDTPTSATKETFEGEVEKLVATGQTLAQATRTVIAQKPALHDAFLVRQTEK